MNLGLKAIILGLGIWVGLLAAHGNDPKFPTGIAILAATAAILIAAALA